MSRICTLAWKDFKLLVTSPMFHLITFFCTMLWSYSYIRNIFQFAQRSAMAQFGGGAEGQMNVQVTVFLAHISQINLIFIFAIPALTMRLLSEEKKLRTYDLLLTAPITATDIAVGKFLAAFGAALTLVAISFIYPLGTAFIANVNFGPLLSAYLGLLLVAACYVAVGIFSSALTESIVLSVVMGLIFNLVLWFISQGTDFSDNSVYQAVMEYISLGQHFMSFIRGSIKTSSIVFFVSVVSLFVFLTQRVVESSRWR